MTETFDSINRWQRETFPKATIVGVLKHIDEEWDEFKNDWQTITEKAEEAADLIILLSCFLDHVTGSEESGAQIHVDLKMRRNRARDWNIQADGTGRHAT